MISTNQKLLMARAGNQPLDPAWNLAFAQFDGGLVPYFLVSNQDSTPGGVSFSSDGAFMYIIGSGNDLVYQYVLSTAWTISTATYYQSTPFNIPDTSPTDLFFSDDGTRLYAVGSGTDAVYQYGLSVAWDIATASFVRSFSVSAQELTPQALFFKPDGTKMYVMGTSGDDVNEYNLATAWDISTATFFQLKSVAGQETGPNALFFKPDGTKMYVMGSSGDDVNEYNLSTAWDISTATFLRLKSISAQESLPTGLYFKPDGTRMYITGSATDTVYAYDLATAWDISTAVYTTPNDYYPVATQDGTPEAIYIKPDGTKMYIMGRSPGTVYQYKLDTAWDLTSAFIEASDSVSAQESSPYGLFFKPDGTRMYVVGTAARTVFQYTLSTAWDVTSASQSGSRLVSSLQQAPTGLFFSGDGTQMFTVGFGNLNVDKYTLTPAWEVGSATFSQSTSIAAQTSSPQDVFFKPDGTRMYIITNDSDSVYEYSLATPWDLTTLTYRRSFGVAQYELSPSGLFFRDTGLEMYIVGIASDAVWMFNFQ